MTAGNDTQPTEISNIFRQAADHFQQGNLPAAESMLQRILDIKPVHADANHLAGLIALQHGQNESAVNAIERAIKSSPRVPEYYYNYGLALYAGARREEALAAYERAIQLKPEFPEAYLNHGITLSDFGRPEEALASYESAISLRPGFVLAFFNHGNALVALERMEEALVDYERATRLDPDFIDAHFNLANTFNNLGHPDKALPAYERVIELDPGHVEAINGRGELLVLLSRLEEALAAFDLAIENQPDFAQAHYNRGNCLKQLGRLPEAADAFRTALRHDPDHVDAGYFLRVVDGEKPPARSPREYVIKEFDGFSDSFDRHLVEGLGYRIPRQLFNAVSGVIGDSTEKLDILDLGCGTGLVGAAFSAIARRLDGVDLSPRMLAKSRERGIYTDLIEADVNHALERLNHCYDLVLSADVFIYIGDLEELFSLVTRNMHGDSLFAFSIEAVEGTDDYRLTHTGRYSHSPDYIRTLALANRLEIVKCLPVMVRTEKRRPVDGYIMVLRRLQPGPE